ncbi:Putative aliphatic sulfonates transport permease protein SsuC [Methylobacterium crusticola]|uniref:Aliphatic sulfonates transport permease protein SsuC n=1 Tax=Methylobacterium crusticola TaxID=1697972 RepID=A0ABQ4QT19_9HYPH|nr:ABC transporter permease [Methylobacterium crusticola]GJD48332.1 Putative aliphatic sulfonates transport permease protein SsuC [Methylobacterium crusticola]
MTRPATAAARLRRGLVLPVLLLLAREAASRSGLVDPRFLPPLGTILSRALAEIRTGGLLGHLAASLARDLAGFAAGTGLGIAFGALLGASPLAGRLLGPTFRAFRQVAILAWIPIISVWFGFAETAKVVFIALAAFVPVAVNTQEGVAGAPAQLLEVARALRFDRRQRVLKVLLPAARPSILTGIHLALISWWLATVGAEYFRAVGPGIGGLIIAGRERFQMDLVMLGVVILGLVGFLLNLAAGALAARSPRWRDA